MSGYYENRRRGDETAGDRRRSKTDNIVSVTVVTIIVFLLWILQGNLPLWMHTDNYWLASVLDGLYANENYSEFINPVLAGIVKLLGRVFPTADAFTLCGEMLALLALWCVLYVLIRNTSIICFGAVVFGIFVLNQDVNLLHLPFTSLTAWFFCAGCLLLYASLHTKIHIYFIWIGAGLILSGLLYRETTVLMLLPFVCLILLEEWMERMLSEKNAEEKRQDISSEKRKGFSGHTVRIILVLAGCCLLLMGVKRMTDASSKYSDGIEYSLARAELVDFSSLPWEECGKELKKAGYSKNDYEAVRSLMLADTQVISASFCSDMAQLTRTSTAQKWQYFISQGLTDKIQAIGANKALKVQILLIVFLLIPIFLSGMKLLRKLMAAAAVLGGALIMFIFTFLDHMPLYLVQAVLFGIWLVLACVVISVDHEQLYRSSRVGQGILHISALLCIGVLLVMNGNSLQRIRMEHPLRSLHAKVEEPLDFAAVDDHEDTVYIWNVYQYDRIIRESSWYASGKLLPQNFLAHNVVDGEWQYGQPYFKEYLQRIGSENPMKALLEREHTYYVAGKKRTKMVKKFIRQHYDVKVNTECVGHVQVSGNQIPIWKFKRCDE